MIDLTIYITPFIGIIYPQKEYPGDCMKLKVMRTVQIFFFTAAFFYSEYVSDFRYFVYPLIAVVMCSACIVIPMYHSRIYRRSPPVFNRERKKLKKKREMKELVRPEHKILARMERYKRIHGEEALNMLICRAKRTGR